MVVVVVCTAAMEIDVMVFTEISVATCFVLVVDLVATGVAGVFFNLDVDVDVALVAKD